jgi:hypothetical protein
MKKSIKKSIKKRHTTRKQSKLSSKRKLLTKNKKGGACFWDSNKKKYESNTKNKYCDPKKGDIYPGFNNQENFGFYKTDPITPPNPIVSSRFKEYMGSQYPH